MDDDEDLPDSMELLLSEMELPEPEASPKQRPTEDVGHKSSSRQSSHIPSFVCLGSATTNANVEFHPLGHIQHRHECRRLVTNSSNEVCFEAEISWTKLFGISWPENPLCLEEHDESGTKLLLNLFHHRMSSLQHVSGTICPNLDWKQFSKDLVEFLAFLRHEAQAVSSDRLADPEESRLKASALLRVARGIHLFVGKFSCLPKHIRIGSFEAAGREQRQQVHAAAFFHLALDSRFTIFRIVSLLAKSDDLQRRNSYDEFEFSRKFCQFLDLGLDEIQQLLPSDCSDLAQRRLELSLQNVCELVSLALERFRAVDDLGRLLLQSPFACACVREMWALLVEDVEATQPGLFWKTLHVLLLSEGEDNLDQRPEWHSRYCSQIPYSRNMFAANSSAAKSTSAPFKSFPLLFSWWLVNGILSLNETASKSAGELLEQLLQRSLPPSVVTDLSPEEERQMRIVLLVLVGAAPRVGPSLPVLHALWDVFHRCLNCAFRTSASASVGNAAAFPSALAEWIGALELNSQDIDVRSAFHKKSSFFLYLRLVKSHLEESGRRDGAGAAQRLLNTIMGRIMSKLSAKKLKELKDTGWYHVFSLLMQLVALDANPASMATRCKGVLSSVKPQDLGQRLTRCFMRGQAALTLLLAGLGQRADDSVEVFMFLVNGCIDAALANKASSQQVDACRSAVSLYAELITAWLDLDQHKENALAHSSFVSPSVAKSLREWSGSSVSASVKRALANFVSLMHDYYARLENIGLLSLTEQEADLARKVTATRNALNSVVFPVVRDLCTSSAVVAPDALAALAANLVVLSSSGDSHEQLALVGTAAAFSTGAVSAVAKESFDVQYDFFAKSVAVKPAVRCHFLASCVRSAAFLERLFLVTGSYSGLVSGWLRCAALLPLSAEVWDNSDLQLKLGQLSADVVKEVPDLHDLRQAMANPKDVLETFLVAVGRLVTPNQNDLLHLRERYQPYLVTCIESLISAKHQPEMKRPQLLRLYRYAAVMLENCSVLLYKHAGFNHMAPLLQELVTSNAMKAETYTLTAEMSEAVAQCIPSVVAGLLSLPRIDEDAFVARVVADLTVIYLPRFAAGANSPMLSCCVMTRRSPQRLQQEQALRKMFFVAVRDNFLNKRSRPQDKLRLRGALAFLQSALTLDRTHEMVSAMASALFPTLLDIAVKSKDDLKARAVALDVIKGVLHNRQNAGKADQAHCAFLARATQNFVASEISFNSKEMFSLLKALQLCDRQFMVGLLPYLTQQVIATEAKRGCGQDTNLRRQLAELQS